MDLQKLSQLINAVDQIQEITVDIKRFLKQAIAEMQRLEQAKSQQSEPKVPVTE